MTEHTEKSKLEEGWPKGVSPAQQYDTYLYLLNSVFAFNLRDDQVDATRRRAENQDGSYTAKQALAWTALPMAAPEHWPARPRRGPWQRFSCGPWLRETR